MNDFGPNPDRTVWRRIRRTVGEIGRGALTRLLVAWYAASDKKTPKWAQARLLSALAYFGVPVDAVPDFVPGAGYGDDMAVLAAAMAATAMYVRPRHWHKARKTMRMWGFAGPGEAPPA